MYLSLNIERTLTSSAIGVPKQAVAIKHPPLAGGGGGGGGLGETVIDTGREASPTWLLEFVNVTESLKLPCARLFALLLIDTVTVAVAPATSVPLAADNVTQDCVFDAVQSREVPPMFWRV
jgi:hypothetical protein